MPIKTVFIGCGCIVGHHCCSIVVMDGIELVAVCDLEEGKACVYGEEFGVFWHINYCDMLDCEFGIDMVVIIILFGMYAEYGLELLECYGKNIVFEKLIVMCLVDLVTIYKIVDSLGHYVFFVF